MQLRFVDARGTEWEVRELGAPTVVADRNPARGGQGGATASWLVFESATQRRRLDRYPARWHAMSPAELAALCQSARPDPPPPSLAPWFIGQPPRVRGGWL